MNRKIDHDKVVELVNSGRNFREIAQILGCNHDVAGRIARARGINVGKGGHTRRRKLHKKNLWHYRGMTSQLAYIVGAYLTDGSVLHRNGKPITFKLAVTDIDFAIMVYECLASCDLSPKYREDFRNSRYSPNGNTFYVVESHFRPFCYWLEAVSDRKSKTPDVILDARIGDALYFIAATIDGDGNVRQKTIRVNGTQGWLGQLPELLTKCGIRTTGYQIEGKTKSGKDYGVVYVNKQDANRLDIPCAIKRKRDMIVNHGI